MSDDQKPVAPIIWPWWKPMPTPEEREQREREFDQAVGNEKLSAN